MSRVKISSLSSGAIPSISHTELQPTVGEYVINMRLFQSFEAIALATIQPFLRSSG